MLDRGVPEPSVHAKRRHCLKKEELVGDCKAEMADVIMVVAHL